MDDLVFLSARHTVSIKVENRSWGTTKGDVSLSSTVVIENEGRKLTAHASTFGSSEKITELRQEAIQSALARLRRQIEALEAVA
jgi:hypothetical protein